MPSRPERPASSEQRLVHTAPLTVAAVASRLGVAASTLRTWDRRYGLGPSSHEAGSHRRYTPADVARLERMRQLTLEGVAPADAARIAADGADLAGGAAADDAAGTGTVGAEEPGELLVDPLSLAAAAVEPDPQRTRRMVEQAVRADGIVETWVRLAGPALEMIGQRGRTDRPGNDPEVVLADAVLGAVRTVSATAERSRDAARSGAVLLLAGLEGRMPAHVIGAALVERGISARMLRAESDVVSLTRSTITERGTRVLAVLGGPNDVEDVVRAVADDGAVEVFLLGPEAPEVWLPRVHRVRTLRAAVDEIAEILRA